MTIYNDLITKQRRMKEEANLAEAFTATILLIALAFLAYLYLLALSPQL